MTEIERTNELRELLMNAPESNVTRLLALVVSLALAISVLWLVRTRRLREEYTPIWLLVSAALLFLSIRYDVLRALTAAIGAWTPSSTVFFLGEVFLVVISLNYAVRLSRTNVQLKNLAQEVALLRADLKRVANVAASQADERD